MTARDSRNSDSERERQLPAPRPEHGLEPVDALTLYMSELRNYAPISREEEHLLATRWVEQGDREAGRQLVLANLRLVVKIAMEYRRAWTNVLDLIQEGNLGLLQAVQRFDPTRGTKLSSYAAYWIRAYILKYLIDNIRLVRLGTSRAQRKLFFRLNKEKRELESQGYEVGPKLLAERLDVSEQDVVDMEQRLSESELSLDAPVQDERDSASFGEFIPTGGESVEEHVASNELRRQFPTTFEWHDSRLHSLCALGEDISGDVIQAANIRCAKFQLRAAHACQEFVRVFVGRLFAVHHKDLRVIGTARDRAHIFKLELAFAQSHRQRVTIGEGHDGVAIRRARAEILHR